MLLQQDAAMVERTVIVERTGGDHPMDVTLRTASRFGAWRARMQLLAAMWLGRRAMNALHDANPMKVCARSIIDKFNDGTRHLPGRGVMPLDPNAPLLRGREVAWIGVALTLTGYVTCLAVGDRPIAQLVEALF